MANNADETKLIPTYVESDFMQPRTFSITGYVFRGIIKPAPFDEQYFYAPPTSEPILSVPIYSARDQSGNCYNDSEGQNIYYMIEVFPNNPEVTGVYPTEWEENPEYDFNGPPYQVVEPYIVVDPLPPIRIGQ